MTKVHGAASAEKRAESRMKRHRRVVRNRIIFGVCVAVVIALIVGFIVFFTRDNESADDRAATTTLTFLDNGQVVCEEVTDFDDEAYTKEDLKYYTDNLIDSFNSAYGESAVALNDLKVKSGDCYMKTTYQDYEAYGTFTGYEVYSGLVESAVEEGYDFVDRLCIVRNADKGEVATLDGYFDLEGYKVVIIEENITVKVPGNIIYVSEASTEIIDESTVSIAQADGNADATDRIYIIYE